MQWGQKHKWSMNGGIKTRNADNHCAGQTYYDEVVSEGGQQYLRAATLVPAVNAKCVLCHPKSKVGDPLGTLNFKIPVR